MADADRPDEQRVRLRVRYSETDRMGVAYHTHYFSWFELGRTELMRGLGITYRDLEEDRGIYFPVRNAEARYHASARYDEELVVCTRVIQVGGASVAFGYRLLRPVDGTLLSSGSTEHAAVDPNGRPARLPADLRDRLRTLVACD